MSLAPVVLSLCDHSGVWSAPYREAGYIVQRVDLKLGSDVRLLEYPGPVRGVLAAPPCTAFAIAGAQFWRDKDRDGRTLEGLAVVDACLRLIAISRPSWWALENPAGRLRRWLGPPRYSFNPCDFAGAPGLEHEAYTKRTLLWGEFQSPRTAPAPAAAVIEWPGMRLGGSSERTKELRSITPGAFARAFFEANP